MKITNFERLKMLSLPGKETKSHRKQKLCFISTDKFNNKEKIIGKFQIIVIVVENIRVRVLHVLYAI